MHRPLSVRAFRATWIHTTEDCQNLLRGELHRVPPLRHVRDFLSLVNLVNQFRRVIDQTHRRFTRHTGAAQTIDVGDAQAVKTQMRFFDLDKKLLPSPRRLKRKFNGEFLFRLADAFKPRTQRGRHRHGERPIFAAFGRGKRDFVLRKINAVEWDSRFPQPAARYAEKCQKRFASIPVRLSTLPEFR